MPQRSHAQQSKSREVPQFSYEREVGKNVWQKIENISETVRYRAKLTTEWI